MGLHSFHKITIDSSNYLAWGGGGSLRGRNLVKLVNEGWGVQRGDVDT